MGLGGDECVRGLGGLGCAICQAVQTQLLGMAVAASTSRVKVGSDSALVAGDLGKGGVWEGEANCKDGKNARAKEREW